MKKKNTLNNEVLAEFMHNKYEAIAIEEGWETQKSTHQLNFKDLPEENKKVMLRLAEEILELIAERVDIAVEVWMDVHEEKQMTFQTKHFIDYVRKQLGLAKSNSNSS